MDGIRQKRQPRRIPAAIIAALYLYLSIFGPLTHSHLLQGGNELAVRTLSHGVAASLHAVTGHAHSTRCPYCEWEANCLSAALPNFQVAQTPIESVYSFSRSCGLHSRFQLRLSSRGPPCA